MIAFRDSAQGSNNNTTVTITVPSTCQTGDVFIVHLSQNNSDVITSSPATLVLLDNNTSISTTYTTRLYYGVVDGVSILPGTTLSWGLSATRNWTTNLYAASGVHSTNPVQGLWPTSAVTTSVTLPTVTTLANSWLLEIGSAKSNGTSITSWTPPSGWTIQAMAPASTGTFQGSSFIADFNTGTAPAGGYGGETYTPNATPNIVMTYLLALNPNVIQTSWVRI